MPLTPPQQAVIASIAEALLADNSWLTREQADIIAMWATHAWQGTVAGRAQFADQCRHRAVKGETWGKLSPDAQQLLADLCEGITQAQRKDV